MTSRSFSIRYAGIIIILWPDGYRYVNKTQVTSNPNFKKKATKIKIQTDFVIADISDIKQYIVKPRSVKIF